MKTLLIGRHAKSDRSMELIQADRERPLNERGLQDAPKLGKALHRIGFIPDLVLSSPAKRALTTARLIMNEIEYRGEILTDEQIYSGGLMGTLTCIQETNPAINRLACFGHNPVVSELIQQLTKMNQSFLTPTGTMALIHFHTQSWEQIEKCRAELVFYLIPRLL